MDLPQEGVHKAHVHLDRDKVRRHEADEARREAHETPEERAEKIKNA